MRQASSRKHRFRKATNGRLRQVGYNSSAAGEAHSRHCSELRSVSTDTMLPPETTRDKFKTGLEDSFDCSSFIFAGLQAGLSQASDSYPASHHGAKRYGRYYWHTFVDQTEENLLVESILPTVLHEDSRYYVLGPGGFLKRTGYPLSRVLITQDDGGGKASMPMRLSAPEPRPALVTPTIPDVTAPGLRRGSAGLRMCCWTARHRSQGVLA